MKSLFKSKGKTCIILIILFCQQFYILSQQNSNAVVQPINNDFIKNNPVAPPLPSYSDIHLNDSLVYLVNGFSFDVMNVANLNDIKKLHTIELNHDLILDYHYSFKILDWESNSILLYYYNPLSGEFNVTNYNFNNIQYTGTLHYSYNMTLNFTTQYSSNFFWENNMLYIVLVNEERSYFIEEISIEIKLLTLDITNKTNPKIIDPPISIYNSTGLEEWEETDRLISTRNKFSFYDNQLYLVRAYESQEDRGYFDSGDQEFSFGFMKAWDISNYTNPKEDFTLEVEQWKYSSISVLEDLLFYRLDNFGFILYNCSDMQNIKYLTTYKDDDNLIQMVISEDLLYLIFANKIQILDIKNPEKIKKIGRYIPHFQGKGSFRKAILEKNILYIIRSSEFEDRRFFVIDCGNPNNPKKLFPLGSQLSEDNVRLLKIFLLYLGMPITIIAVIVTITIVLMRKQRKKLINNT